MELKKEVKRKHLLKIVNNLWMCNESTVASARSVPVCAGLLATPHCDPLWKAHRLVFWVAQSFIFINERFYNLSPVVKDSPNWKKFEKRKVLNFSSGQGSNGQKTRDVINERSLRRNWALFFFIFFPILWIFH